MEWKWLVDTTLYYIRGKSGVGRSLDVFPEDVYLVSFPRSGNTWTRFLVGNLLSPAEPLTFANLERKVPDIYINSRLRLLRLPRPRVLKSHEPFDPRYKKIIYIIRDPRDAAVSSYHFHIKYSVIAENHPIGDYVSDWITGRWWPHGNWAQHVLSWVLTRQNSRNFHFVRYEDLLKDPLQQLRRIADFMGLGAGEEILRRAVDLSSAANLRRLERQQWHLWRGTQRSRKDKDFVRTAKAGGWPAELPPASIQDIERSWAPLLKRFGYALSTSLNAPSCVDHVDLNTMVLPPREVLAAHRPRVPESTSI